MDNLITLKNALLPVSKKLPPSADKNSNTLIRQASVLLALVRRSNIWYAIFTKRTDHLKHHAGQISFPGGVVEPDDRSLSDTALRETHEEIGIIPNCVHILGQLPPFPTLTGFHITPIVGLIDEDCVLIKNDNEVAEIFEAPLAFFFNPDNRAFNQLVYQGKAREFVEFQYKEHRIWGATAGILYALQQRWTGLIEPIQPL